MDVEESASGTALWIHLVCVAQCSELHSSLSVYLLRFARSRRDCARMQSKVLLLALVLAALISDGFCETKPRKLKKYHRKPKPPLVDGKESIDSAAAASIADGKDGIELSASDESEEKKSEESQPMAPPVTHDICANKHCGAGRVCDVTDDGVAQCVCVPYCTPEADSRRKVCSNHNETWGSDCEVYQMRCWCDHKDQRCKDVKYQHLHIDYYGECKEMQDCKESEMLDFPRRMRDWLFNIMRDMADRSELTPHYLELEREAESNMTRRWTNAAIWKWCDLDGHPHDRTVSRHELFPIRAPLMTLEHCIAPFLNGCDVNDDHRITLKEWGKCLELPEDDLEEKCEEIREEEEARG